MEIRKKKTMNLNSLLKFCIKSGLTSDLYYLKSPIDFSLEIFHSKMIDKLIGFINIVFSFRMIKFY